MRDIFTSAYFAEIHNSIRMLGTLVNQIKAVLTNIIIGSAKQILFSSSTWYQVIQPGVGETKISKACESVCCLFPVMNSLQKRIRCRLA